MLRVRAQLVLFVFLAQYLAPLGWGQTATRVSLPTNPAPQPPAALLHSVRVVLEPDHPAVEITASRPLTPQIKVMEKPQRLVIDLNDALVSESKWIRVRNKQVSGMRVSQFQTNPPVVRIVLDLLKPSGYTWKSEGDVLTIRLGPKDKTTAPAAAPKSHPPPAPAMAQTMKPALIAPVPGTSGAILESGSQPAGGSSVYAGSETAIVHLPRGGEVRVCPGTTISVTYSQSGQDMMVGMSTGSLELHYRLGASNDAVVTPDFRIMLPGPGEFHYAVSADSKGNTCVRALPGNSAPVVVAELMGDGIYDVKPAQQVTFRSGRLASISATVPSDCGCPEPGAQVMRASGQEPPTVPPAAATEHQPASAPQIAANMPETAPVPASKPADVQVQVEAPFVFRGDQPPPRTEAPPKTETETPPMVAAEKPEPMEVNIGPSSTPDKVAAQQKKKTEKRSFMSKLKGMFSGIFH